MALPLLLMVVGHGASYGDWVVDDAAISFAYAKNLVAGEGLTVNPGLGEAPVEGYSNPLWMSTCALGLALGVFDPVWFPKVAGLIFLLGTLALIVDLVRRLDGRPVGWLHLLAPACLAVNGSVVVWSVSGLENAQHLFFIVLALVLQVRDRQRPDRLPWSWLPMIAVALGRPEGLMYVLVIWGDATWWAIRRRRIGWLAKLLTLTATPLLVYGGWKLAYFGDLLPNTYYAKLRLEDASLWRRLIGFDRNGWQHIFGAIGRWRLHWMVLLAALAPGLRGTASRGLLAVIGAFGASLLFVVVVGADWMMQFRLLHPMFALLALLATLGLIALRDRLAPRCGRWTVVVVAVIAAGGWVTTLSALPGQHRRMSTPPNPTMPFSRATTFAEVLFSSARQVDEQTPVLAMSAMGAASWRNRGQVRLIDLAGLTHREMARARYERRDGAEVCRYLFGEQRPAMVQLFGFVDQWWQLSRCPEFRRLYAGYDRIRERGDPDPEGLYIRRDLVEAAPGEWEDELLLRSGALRVHRLEIEAQRGRKLPLRIWFSLARPARRRPKIRLALQTQQMGRRVVVEVGLLRLLPYPALRPGIVYRDRTALDVPPWARVVGVRPLDVSRPRSR